MLRADLHVHTSYSLDCETSLQQVISRCIKMEINCLAIADHGTIAGALELRKIAPFSIIIAEEILTPFGEIMGMFLTERIPSNITVEETITKIKSQGGLVCIPHPYDKFRPSAFDSKQLEKIMPSIDIIEVFNARSLTPGCIRKARQLVNKYDKLSSAGSDAHTPLEIGYTYIEMAEYDNKEEFVKSLYRGKIIGHKSNPFVHLSSTKNKIGKLFPKRD